MRRVEDIAREIIAREGGYVNDPDDPGGATKFGVTIHTLRRLKMDLDGNGVVNGRDVKHLTRDDAQRIFVQHYFQKPKISQLPQVLQASVFDMYVNSGSNAVKILQQLFCDMGQVVVVDGGIGPQTIDAAKIAIQIAPHHLADAYGIARRNYYYRLADARPKSRKYARRRDGGKGGWIVRAESFIARKYHLSPMQHQKRISLWD